MTDQLITKIPLIGRYSRHNESQDYKFRAFLKVEKISNEELDETVQGITDNVWKQIDCLKCANCCKVLEVVVDDADIDRLATRLSISRSQFVKRYIGLVDSFGKHLKSQPCVFLGEDNHCNVYDDRPKACKDFPYLHNKNFRNRTISMLGNLGTCPIVFNVWQQLKAKLWGAEPAQLPVLKPRKRR